MIISNQSCMSAIGSLEDSSGKAHCMEDSHQRFPLVLF